MQWPLQHAGCEKQVPKDEGTDLRRGGRRNLRVSRGSGHNNLHCFWQLSLAPIVLVGSPVEKFSLSLFLCGRITSLDRARHVIGCHCPRASQRSQTKGSSVMVPHCLPACLRYPRAAGLRCANFDPWHELSTPLSFPPSLSTLVHLFCLVLLALLSTRLPLALTRHFARADILYARSPRFIERRLN